FMYFGFWALTGIPIYFASVGLSAVSARALAYGIAGVLVVAGVFQLSPSKQMCLRHCRSPLAFLLGHWREGWRGGLAMGAAHALYCLGCCWALMLVLVVAGAMGLIWVLLVAAVVAAEKLLPRGEWIARTTGVALVGLVFRIDRGQHGATRLDGLCFAVLAHTPGPMGQGNWTVGVVVDERASAEQRAALTAIASGQGGGPMAALGPLIGRFGGVEAK